MTLLQAGIRVVGRVYPPGAAGWLAVVDRYRWLDALGGLG